MFAALAKSATHTCRFAVGGRIYHSHLKTLVPERFASANQKIISSRDQAFIQFEVPMATGEQNDRSHRILGSQQKEAQRNVRPRSECNNSLRHRGHKKVSESGHFAADRSFTE